MKITSLRLNPLKSDEIKRPVLIDTIKRMLSQNDLVIIEGESGSGKTTFLTQFVHANIETCLSYFVDPSDRFTYNSEAVKYDIMNQLNYYILKKEYCEDFVPDNFITSLRIKLERKIKENKKEFYIILDGLDSVDFNELIIFKNVVEDLPLHKVKFLVSGDQNKILKFFDNKKIDFRSSTLNFFTLEETKEYFSELNPIQEEVLEIYKISNKGQPSRLSIIKRKCKEKGVDFYLNNDLSEKTDLFELEWSEIVFDDFTEVLIGILAYDDTKPNISTLSQILNIPENDIINLLNDKGFIELKDDTFYFISESYREFIGKKLEKKKVSIIERLITFYTTNLSEDSSLFNLPTLFMKAKKYSDLIQHLSLERIIHYVEKTKSILFINKQLEVGLKACKENVDTEGEYLKFALHKSSLKSLEQDEILESEIESLVKLNEIDAAKNKVCSIYIKENRFKAIALLVKILRENDSNHYNDLILLIEELYLEINIENFKENAVEISSLLMYSNPNIAIDLIERLTDKTSSKNSIDYAYSYLSLFINDVNKNLKKNVVDIESINSKIKDEEVKTLTNAINFIGNEYSPKAILELIEKIPSTNKKLTLLRNWLNKNETKSGVEEVLEYALNLIIQSSSDDVPNATVLLEICYPLPFIEDKDKLSNLISQLDSQKSTIVSPTRDFIKLQLLISEALLTIEENRFKDRITEIFIQIDDLKDLSLRNDCLVSLFKTINKTDIGKNFEKELTSKSLLTLIKENTDVLINTTAFQFKIFEYTVRIIVCVDPEFVFNLIEKINIKDRRISLLKIAFEGYVRDKKIELWDKKIIFRFYDNISDINIEESITIYLFEAIEKNKLQLLDASLIDSYLGLIDKIYNPEGKIYCIAKLLNAIDIAPKSFDEIKIKYLSILKEEWEIIDTIWDKIEIGFKISSELSKTFPIEAKSYLDKVLQIKEKENLVSSVIAATLINSIRLSIKAFEGTFHEEDNVLKNIEIL